MKVRTKLGLAVCFAVAVGSAVAVLSVVAPAPLVAGDPPPLVVDKDAPLLLDDAESSSAKPQKEIADNGACYVCHVNYQEDPFVKWHAEEMIGCVDCHGDSFAHRNDENNTTPPETMYPKAEIDEACQQCHETHDAPAVKVVARFIERCPADADLESVVCTDCHGKHRLKIRTVRWNKETGELITETDE